MTGSGAGAVGSGVVVSRRSRARRVIVSIGCWIEVRVICAKQQGVQVQRLHRWKQLLGKPVAEAFVEVPLESHSKPAVEVVLPDGVVVRVCESVDVPLAVELVSALARHR